MMGWIYFAFSLPLLVVLLTVMLGYVAGHVFEQAGVVSAYIGRLAGSGIGAFVGVLILWFWSIQ